MRNFSFDDFVQGRFDYDPAAKAHSCVRLRPENMDVGGGKIRMSDIDCLKDHPEAQVVTVSGLYQDTFEYFIETYGQQFKAIRFFKNKHVADWSLLGALPQLEYVHFFANQKIESLWDMRGNTALRGLCVEDFSRLHSIEGIHLAPALREFQIGNAIWRSMVIDSLWPLANTGVEKLVFTGKSIADQDLSFLSSMESLKTFDFPTNLFSTEQVAWIAANFPALEGFAIKATRDCRLWDPEKHSNVPGVIVIGKRKPSLYMEGNEKRIQKYIDSFEAMKEKYRGIPFHEAFSH